MEALSEGQGLPRPNKIGGLWRTLEASTALQRSLQHHAASPALQELHATIRSNNAENERSTVQANNAELQNALEQELSSMRALPEYTKYATLSMALDHIASPIPASPASSLTNYSHSHSQGSRHTPSSSPHSSPTMTTTTLYPETGHFGPPSHSAHSSHSLLPHMSPTLTPSTSHSVNSANSGNSSATTSAISVSTSSTFTTTIASSSISTASSPSSSTTSLMSPSPYSPPSSSMSSSASATRSSRSQSRSRVDSRGGASPPPMLIRAPSTSKLHNAMQRLRGRSRSRSNSKGGSGGGGAIASALGRTASPSREESQSHSQSASQISMLQISHLNFNQHHLRSHSHARESTVWNVTSQLAVIDPYAWLHAFQRAASLASGPSRRKALSMVHLNFVRTATEVCTRLLTHDPTLKPKLVGPPGGRRFLAQGIFLKYCQDPQMEPGVYLYGGTSPSIERAAKAAANTLRSTNEHFAFFWDRNIPITVPVQVLIDICGERIVAMPWLPLTDKGLVYGSADGGRTVMHSDPVAAAAMRAVGKALHFAPHPVNLTLQEPSPPVSPVLPVSPILPVSPSSTTDSISSSSTSVRLASAGDVEVHLGTDARLYLLDSSRVFPPECVFDGSLCGLGEEGRIQASPLMQHLPFAPGSIWFRMFRPEWLQAEKRSGFASLSPDAWSEWGVDAAQLDETQYHLANSYLSTRRLMRVAMPALATALDQAVRNHEHAIDNLCQLFVIHNPLLAPHVGEVRRVVMEIASSPETIAAENVDDHHTVFVEGYTIFRVAVREFTKHHQVVGGPSPREVECPCSQLQDFSKWIVASDISLQFHSFGVGMRHLGYVRSLCQHAASRQLLLQEMALRSAKHLMRASMRSSTSSLSASNPASVLQQYHLNSLLRTAVTHGGNTATVRSTPSTGLTASPSSKLGSVDDSLTMEAVFADLTKRFGPCALNDEETKRGVSCLASATGDAPEWLVSQENQARIQTLPSLHLSSPHPSPYIHERSPELDDDDWLGGFRVKTLAFLDLVTVQTEMDEALCCNWFVEKPPYYSTFMHHVQRAHTLCTSLRHSYPGEPRVRGYFALLQDILFLCSQPSSRAQQGHMAQLLQRAFQGIHPLGGVLRIMMCLTVAMQLSHSIYNETSHDAVLSAWFMSLGLSYVSTNTDEVDEQALLRVAAVLAVRRHAVAFNWLAWLARTKADEHDQHAIIDTMQVVRRIIAPICAQVSPSSLENELSLALDAAVQADNELIVKWVMQQPEQPKSKMAVYHAASRGNSRLVRMLVDHHFPANYRDATNEYDALTLAVLQGHNTVGMILVQHNADLHSVDKDGNSALMYCAQHNRFNILSLLLHHTVDVNQENKEGCTPLAAAVAGGFVDIVERLIERKADVNKPAQRGMTPLLVGAASANAGWDVVEPLLKHGANLQASDAQGRDWRVCLSQSSKADVLKVVWEQKMSDFVERKHSHGSQSK